MHETVFVARLWNAYNTFGPGTEQADWFAAGVQARKMTQIGGQPLDWRACCGRKGPMVTKEIRAAGASPGRGIISEEMP